MKKALVAAIIGIASVAVSYGQGHVLFSTYVGTVYQPVTFSGSGAGHTDGEVAGPSVTGQLYYALGASQPFASMVPVPGAIAQVGTAVAGYLIGNNVTVPNYVSGPISFGILAWEGADYASALWATASAVTWTETSINPVANPTDVFQQNVPAIQLTYIPEPSSFALMGLGAAALLAFRRRQ